MNDYKAKIEAIVHNMYSGDKSFPESEAEATASLLKLLQEARHDWRNKLLPPDSAIFTKQQIDELVTEARFSELNILPWRDWDRRGRPYKEVTKRLAELKAKGEK